jgi:hypothetical protein
MRRRPVAICALALAVALTSAASLDALSAVSAMSAMSATSEAPAAAPAQALDRLTIEARAADTSQLDVVATYYLANAAQQGTLVHRAMLFPGTRIDRLRASSGGRDVAVHQRLEARSLELRIDAAVVADGAYQLAYHVTSEANPRFPVFVPISYQVPPTSRLDLEIHTPPGVTLGGDSFPRLVPAGDGFSASLVNVPSFMLVPLQRAGASSPLDAYVTVSALTNVAFFVMLLGASVQWWRLRRRALALQRRSLSMRP